MYPILPSQSFHSETPPDTGSGQAPLPHCHVLASHLPPGLLGGEVCSETTEQAQSPHQQVPSGPPPGSAQAADTAHWQAGQVGRSAHSASTVGWAWVPMSRRS